MLLLLTKARSILSPEERSSVQIVFADLDPEDTLSQIRSFVERFDPEVLGISLTPFLRREMEKALAIPSFVGEGGLVEHIAYAVGVDRNGMAKVLFTQEENPEEIAHDYKVLLRGSFSPLWIKEGAILLFRTLFSLFS
jgi:cytochrome oxidase Cu insertion factor (SCO1/SenC/PrrC family)